MSTSAAIVIPVSSEEILTGEAVALDVQPLSFFMRALGTLIDVVVTVLVLTGFLFAIDRLLPAGIAEDTAPIVVIVTVVLAWVVAPTLVESLTRGRSLGKLAVGGRIVRSDGGAIGIRHAFVRAMLGVLEIWFTLGGLAAITGTFTPRSQRLGDLVAGTYCQRTRNPQLSTDMPGPPPQLAGWVQVADVARLPDRLSRRVAQFVRNSDRMDPLARARVAANLADEVVRFVSPVPAAPPEVFLHAVAAVRRDRQLRALGLQQQRVDALLRGGSDRVPGFPARQ